jgi:pyruvate,water dikinase
LNSSFPAAEKIFSVFEDGLFRPLSGLHTKKQVANAVATFNGLLSDMHFAKQIEWAMDTLSGAFGGPVDIEFASDSDDLYLLQCRPQSRIREDIPENIPAYIPPNDIFFEATKYISHAALKDISHAVIIDAAAYGALASRAEMIAVGEIVGTLNKLLHPRRFILIGPGRWGSRGDIRLGVRVSYSDINNTALLVEVGDTRSEHVPELSFGTHFFQDLVEGNIRYLPIYQGDDKNRIHEDRLAQAENNLTRYIPEAGRLQNVVRVINFPESFSGRTLKVIMNADENRAVGMLVSNETHCPLLR